MNTILNILPWALAILAGVLYYLSRQKLNKSVGEIKSLESTQKHLCKVMEEETLKLNPLHEKVKNLSYLVDNLRQVEVDYKSQVNALEDDNLRLQSQLDSAQETIKSFEDGQIDKPATGITFKGIFKKLGEMRFTNGVTIFANGQIKLKAIELLHQNHIIAIQKLQKAGLFPANLLEDEGVFKFDPKTLEVTIQMISVDQEGEPIGFHSWDWFLFCREEFIAELSNYISGLLQEGKRHEIAKQVIAEITAPEGSEVTNA